MKKTQNFFNRSTFLGILLICFLVIAFFCVPTNKAISVGLEIQYPVISQQTINENTKLPDYLSYLFNAGMFIGFFAVFLSLIIAGVLFFLSPVKPDLQADAKDRVSGAISGLLLLALVYLIITTINPQLSVFYSEELPAVEITTEDTTPSGVYFYEQNGCVSNATASDTLGPYTSSVADFGKSKNKIKSINIVQDEENENYYIAVVFSQLGFWGSCTYINPNVDCPNWSQFSSLSSASIYEYDFEPDGGGVYFFRKSCFNDQPYSNANSLISHCKEGSVGGGYFYASNDEIKNGNADGSVYIKQLNNYYFTAVPEQEKECVRYNTAGDCVTRQTPSLAGENISSMIINGNYLVLFFYAPGGGVGDNPNVQNASCQAFPTPDDINKIGPRQIKWENIRNSNGVVPNYVAIIPVK